MRDEGCPNCVVTFCAEHRQILPRTEYVWDRPDIWHITNTNTDTLCGLKITWTYETPWDATKWCERCLELDG